MTPEPAPAPRPAATPGQTGGGTPEAWFSPGRFALLLLFCIGAAFPGVIFGNQSFVARDFGAFSYPVAHYQRECFWRGEIPLWNPLHNCGVPFLAQFNTITLYPLSLIYLLLPLDWSLGVFCLAHLFIAGMGMYFLAQRWTGNRLAAALAGMAFAFNGLALNFLMWPSHEATYAWMPWVVWSVELGWQRGGRRLVWAAIFGALQMLGGGPETILMTWLVLTAMWLGQLFIGRQPRRELAWRFPAMAVLVAGLAAAQLLPFLDLMAHAQRSADYAGQNGWAMPGTGWSNFFVPLAGLFPLRKGFYAQEGQNWTSSYYAGIGVAVLALMALWRLRNRRVWMLGLMACLGVLLAMGENNFAFKALKAVFPALGFMSHPIKFVLLTIFALPLLAAFGVVELQRLATDGSAKAWRLIVVFGAGAGLLIAAIVVHSRLHPADAEVWSVTASNGLGRFGMLAAVLGVLALLGSAAGGRTRQLLGLAVVLLAWGDVVTHAPSQNPTADRSVFQSGLVKLPPQPQSETARAFVTYAAIDKMLHGTSGNVGQDFLLYRQGLFLDCNLLDDIPTVGGFYSLYLKADLPIRALLGGTTGPAREALADFMGIAWESAPEDVFKFAARTTFLPLLTGGQQPVFKDPAGALAFIQGRDFDPRRVVCLPLEAQTKISATNAATIRIASQTITAQKIDFEVEASGPALIVAAQSYYHPWRAWANGRETPVFRANYGFQAFEVPAGRSQVRLEYRDNAFRTGVILCGVSMVGCLALWWLAPRWKKR